MSIATDLKKYADSALAQGKSAAAESAKPLYAWVGASDLAVEQTKALAGKAAQRVSDRVTAYRNSLGKAVADVGDTVQEIPVAVRNFSVKDVRKNVEKTASDYSSTALGLYAHLSQRGENIVDELASEVRNAPVVKRVVGVANESAETAQNLRERGVKAARNTVAEAAEAVADGAEAFEAEVAPNKYGARKAAATRAARKSAKQAEATTSAPAKPKRRSAKSNAAKTVTNAAPSTPAKSAAKSTSAKTAAKTTPRKAAAKNTPAKSATTTSTPAKSAPAKSTSTNSTSTSSDSSK